MACPWKGLGHESVTRGVPASSSWAHQVPSWDLGCGKRPGRPENFPGPKRVAQKNRRKTAVGVFEQPVC